MLAGVVGLRSGKGLFSSGDILQMFDMLRLPQPGNVSQVLSEFRKKHLMVRQATGRLWSLTPEGHQQSLSLLEGLQYVDIAVALAGTPGAEFAHTRHPVIDPAFAPPRWSQGISRLLERFPFETNVFCMTRFPKDVRDGVAPDPVQPVVDGLREVMRGHGLTLHLASDRQIDDEPLANVGAFMWACSYGIGLLEDRAGRGLNYNVVIEVGAMLMTGRRCALLKDRTAPPLPVDLAGQIYKSVDFDVLSGVMEATHLWIAKDLSLGRCDTCP